MVSIANILCKAKNNRATVMLFSRQLPLATLIDLCHLLRINLSAGLTLLTVFRQLATRGSRKVRPVAGRILLHLEHGDNLRTALNFERDVFPSLFLDMADLGEKTGRLPEVLEELERYYVQQQKVRRQLRQSSFLPVVQFIIAIGIVALLIFVLGAVAASHGAAAPSVLGFRGTTGAILFLLSWFGLFAAAYATYAILTRALPQQAVVDGLLLQLPVIGPCVQAIVVSRFALALQLTLDTSMPLREALELSYAAAGNAAFARHADTVASAVEEGDELSVALGRGQFMPPDFLSMVAVAEEGGRLVEMMRHQAAYYHEEASRRIQAATKLASGLIKVLYIVLMALGIFQIAGGVIGVVGR
jgi:type II secretory pathway component PulF